MFEKMDLTPVAIRVLTHLARSRGKEYYQRELARSLGMSLGGCHSALARLEEMGLVEKRESGKNVYYRISGSNPSVGFFKVFVSIQELHPLVERLKTLCRRIVLFGSCARGDDTLESDIDLLVVTEDTTATRRIIPSKAGGRQLKPVLVTPGELLLMKEKDPAFYEESGKGIVLWREEDG
jgi:predicted nucleotidyltransferase